MTNQGAQLRSLFCFVRYALGKMLSEVIFAAHIQTFSKRLDILLSVFYTYNIAIARMAKYGYVERYH